MTLLPVNLPPRLRTNAYLVLGTLNAIVVGLTTAHVGNVAWLAAAGGFTTSMSALLFGVAASNVAPREDTASTPSPARATTPAIAAERG